MNWFLIFPKSGGELTFLLLAQQVLDLAELRRTVLALDRLFGLLFLVVVVKVLLALIEILVITSGGVVMRVVFRDGEVGLSDVLLRCDSLDKVVGIALGLFEETQAVGVAILCEAVDVRAIHPQFLTFLITV